MDAPVPANDGVDHINVWSRAATSLGQFLSNFTYAPFTHPEHGDFVSVEGYWYWLAAGCNTDNDRMRSLFGASAKFAGSELETVPMEDLDFQAQIALAIRAKLDAHPDWRKSMAASTLPFRHYFVVSNGKHCVELPRHRWLMELLESLRVEYRMYEQPSAKDDTHAQPA